MSGRYLAMALLLSCLVGTVPSVNRQAQAGNNQAEPSLRYVLPNDSSGFSQAVVVDGLPLIYTRQFLPVDAEGNVVGRGEPDQQIEQVLNQLESTLQEANSSLDELVRVNVCALSHDVAARTAKQLSRRLGRDVRPAITTVLTPIPHRDAVVAVDAVAAAGKRAEVATALKLARCQSVAGDDQCADFATLPRGGVAYLSGQPEAGGLAASAVTQSLTSLLGTMDRLKLTPAHVVQLKVFLTPASSAAEALGEIKRMFPGQLTPPVVFVEWIASVPVEIELVAQWPAVEPAAEDLAFYDPPGVKPSNVFSRVALVRAEKQIFISSLSAETAGDGEQQVRDVFAQLQNVLAQSGSDMRHLAKATYFVSDDDASRMLTRLRPEFLDPTRPPAASKVTVHAVARPDRSLTIDMIAAGRPE